MGSRGRQWSHVLYASFGGLWVRSELRVHERLLDRRSVARAGRAGSQLSRFGNDVEDFTEVYGRTAGGWTSELLSVRLSQHCLVGAAVCEDGRREYAVRTTKGHDDGSYDGTDSGLCLRVWGSHGSGRQHGRRAIRSESRDAARNA